MNVPRLLEQKFKLYLTHFFYVAQGQSRAKIEQPQKKAGNSKGEGFYSLLDANAINDKDVYCYAGLVATSHSTRASKTEKKIKNSIIILASIIIL